MAEGGFAAVIDDLVFEATYCEVPDLIHVSGDIYAVAFYDEDLDGVLVTFSIASDGEISAAIIDSFEFDILQGTYPKIIHISGDVYAIFYKGDGTAGRICTLTISAAGDIGAAVIDTGVFAAGSGSTPLPVHVSGDIYAVAWSGSGSDGYIATISITAAGDIGAAVIDSLEFDAVRAANPFLVHVSGSTYAIAYEGPNSNIKVGTLTISGGGTIGAALIDSLEFDVAYCYEPILIHISGDVWAVVYCGEGNDGTLVTLTINAAGAVGAAVIDTFEFDTTLGVFPDIVHVSGNVYAIAYQGTLTHGISITVDISDAGEISEPAIDTLEFAGVYCANPSLIHVSGNIYAVAYRGSGDVGVVKTIDIETLFPGGAKHFLMMGIG